MVRLGHAEHDLGRHERRGAAGAPVAGELDGIAFRRRRPSPNRRHRLQLHQPEVEHLGEIERRPRAAHHHVRRLDVAVHQAVHVRILQRGADLAQDVDGPLRRQRPVLPYQAVEIEAVEQLHHVVEPAVLSGAEVVELHRVRRLERGRGAGLPLEAPEQQLGIGGDLRPDQLDCRRPDQQPVPRAPDLAHAAAPDLLLEHVLAELVGFGDLAAQSVDDAGHDRGEHGPEHAPEDRVERHVLLLVALAEPGQERRGMVARDAHDHGGQEGQRCEQQRPPRPGGYQDGPDHDGDREGEQHLEDLSPVVQGHEGQEGAGHDDADGIERAQCPGRPPAAPGDEPDRAHRPAPAEVAERDRAFHDGGERRAAEQDHAGEEEEVEAERHEKERPADQRKALPYEVQPVGGVESALDVAHTIRATTTVMLSCPPPASAASTSSRQTDSASAARPSISASRSSGT